KPLTPAVVRLIEERLVATLAVTEGFWCSQDVGSSTQGYCGDSFGDLAAQFLAARWKLPDGFNRDALFEERARQRLGLANRARQKHGLEPLPPEPCPVVAAPASQLRPLLLRVLEGNAAARRQALKAIEALGLPALGAVHQQLAVLPPDHG